MSEKCKQGESYPLGATVCPGGVNFSVFSRNSTVIELLLFDAAGLYQVGRFVGDSWKEWNGKFRDDVRSFVKGDKGLLTGRRLREIVK